MISVENMTKSFGNRILFDRISFKINPKERVGLVGRNGHGKTTLFKIILAQEEHDDGMLNIPNAYRIGHVTQELSFVEKTSLEEGMRGLPAAEKGHHWKVEKILSGLGFSPQDMKREPGLLSGGFQVRLNLAKALVSEPDLLLLDEPTNYLDITSIRWVQRFLKAWPRELMLITHDRSFMDAIVTHIVGIHRKKVRKIPGNTEKYYTQIAQDEEIYEKTRMRDERRQEEIEQFINRFRAKARLAGLVQSRIKTLSKKDKKQKLEKIRDLDFNFKYRSFHGKQLLSVEALSFAYPGQMRLFTNLGFSIHSKDRIGVVGPNGKGKTTLLKLLAGKLAPKTGMVKYHPEAVVGFYEQTNVQSLRDSYTVVQEVQSSLSGGDYQGARNICGAMLFEGDDALKRVALLSGGEKARVILGKVIATPVNLLILDEPTNHLDMESTDALLAAIDEFPGTVILVTHNEMYLHALADRLIVFREGSVAIFEGSYQDFLEAGGWEDEGAQRLSGALVDSPQALEAPRERMDKKALRKKRSRIVGERSKRIKPVVEKISLLEKNLEDHERHLHAVNQELILASREKDGIRIARFSIEAKRIRQEINPMLDDLEKLYLEKETIEAEFAKRLADPDDP